MTVKKSRCGGRWTEARFKSFIKSALRGATRRWGPIGDCKKGAWLKRGFYKCSKCKKESPASIMKDGKRVNNIIVDHVNPIIDPEVGFTNWDDYIERMFCEKNNLQVLCRKCHDAKTKREKELATIRRKETGS